MDFKKVQYEGRKASFVTRNSTLNGNSYYEARASKGEQLGRVSQASVSHNSVLQRNTFGQRKNLQNRKTKRAKASVTAELCHQTQVRKIDPMLRNIFLKLVEKGGEKSRTKKSPKRIVLSSPVWIINPRILKRYLISENLV